MSQMNPKEVFHNTAYSVQLPYIAFKYKKKLLHASVNHELRKQTKLTMTQFKNN